MILSLLIKNLLIIDSLEVNFKNGFNALTGETGAGKSILIDCIGFVLGQSGRRGSIRKDDGKEGEVIVTFELAKNSMASKELKGSGFNIEDELIIRRVISLEGKKRAFVNDKPCSVELLRKLSIFLIEFQGQNEEKGLLNQRNHINFLDDFANLLPIRKTVSQAWTELKRKNSMLEDLKTKSINTEARKEFLSSAISEIEQFDPKIGEEDSLLEKRKSLKNREKILEHLNNGYKLIHSQNIEEVLLRASKELMSFDRLIPKKIALSIEHIDRMLESLGKVSTDLTENLDSLSGELESSESLDERFFNLRSVARKYDTTCDELVRLPDLFRQELEQLEMINLDREKLEREIVESHENYQKLSSNLSSSRIKAAENLDKSVKDQLSHLKLSNSVFHTQISRTEASNLGIDQVYFSASTNKGLHFGPLDEIASGGELSRFLLALKVCLVQDSKDTVLLFDEIDRGVGGSTADAIGRRLLDLSAFGQIITVTHSPQVAALASSHFQVLKELGKNGEVSISIKELKKPDRVEELARMISGKVITSEAKAAADSLISNGYSKETFN